MTYNGACNTKYVLIYGKCWELNTVFHCFGGLDDPQKDSEKSNIGSSPLIFSRKSK